MKAIGNIIQRIANMIGLGSEQNVQQPQKNKQQQSNVQAASNDAQKMPEERKSDKEVNKFTRIMATHGLNLNEEDADKLYDAYHAMKQRGHYGNVSSGEKESEIPSGMKEEILGYVDAFARVGGISEFIRRVVSPMSLQEKAEGFDQVLASKTGSEEAGVAQKYWQNNATKMIHNLFSNVLDEGDVKEIDRRAAGPAFYNFPGFPSNEDLRDLCDRYAAVIEESGGLNQFFEKYVAPLDKQFGTDKVNELCSPTKLALAARELASVPDDAEPNEVKKIAEKYADELATLNYRQYLQDQVLPMDENHYKLLVREDMMAAAQRGMGK